jgi:palmitoyltransferase ZDHHC4
MSSSVTLVVSMIAYAVFLGFVFYFFVFADPDESATALFLTETLPQKTWKIMERTLGSKALYVVEFFVDRMLMVVYCAVVFGAWSVIFAYIYPWIDAQNGKYVSVYHKYVGYAVFGACVSSWRLAIRASPGLITAKNIQRYNHFPYDYLMFVPGQICKTRNIPRLARSKFDRFKYNENVPRFDHYCGWVHNTIGEENYRFFLLFLAVHVAMCAYGTYVVGHLFYGEILEGHLLEATFFDRYTGEEITSSKWIVFQYMFNRYLTEAAVLAIMSVMGAALGLFLAYHAWLTSRGLTTNESYKWSQVQKWYKRELQRYNDAVKNNENVVAGTATSQNSTAKSQPVATDGDVTCTPDINTSATEETDQYDDTAIVHPGPKPVNIYNRGFIENWKEVIFPISLRKEVVARVPKSKET